MRKITLMMLTLFVSILVSAQDRIAVADFSIKPGETKTLSIELINELRYTAFQIDIDFPEGLTVKSEVYDDGYEVYEEFEVALTSRKHRNGSHVVACNWLSSGALRVGAYSSSNSAFSGNSGALLELTLVASETMEGGTISFTSVRFTEPSAEEHIFDNLTYEISLAKTYAISATTADETKGTVAVEGAGTEVAHGTTVKATATPAPGYSFVNWTVGETEFSTENPYTFTASASMDLVANFKVNQYEVAFDVDGKVETLTLDYGTQITMPENPAKEGYTFTGWDPEYVEGATVPVGGIKYTAQWKINNYKVVYMVDGEEYKTVEVEYNAEIPSEAAPTKEGYTFSGWSEAPATMPAQNVEVSGTFTVNQYEVAFDVDGKVETLTLDYGTLISMPENPAKEGYTFTGWDPEYVEGATVPVGGTKYTAQWKINSYKVVYMVDGEEYKTVEVEFNAEIPAEEAPTKEGYTFSGWSETPATMPARDITITGSFSIIDGILGVTTEEKVDVYNLNGVKVAENIAIKDLKTALKKGGYIIKGKKYLIK